MYNWDPHSVWLEFLQGGGDKKLLSNFKTPTLPYSLCVSQAGVKVWQGEANASSLPKYTLAHSVLIKEVSLYM